VGRGARISAGLVLLVDGRAISAVYVLRYALRVRADFASPAVSPQIEAHRRLFLADTGGDAEDTLGAPRSVALILLALTFAPAKAARRWTCAMTTARCGMWAAISWASGS